MSLENIATLILQGIMCFGPCTRWKPHRQGIAKKMYSNLTGKEAMDSVRIPWVNQKKRENGLRKAKKLARALASPIQSVDGMTFPVVCYNEPPGKQVTIPVDELERQQAEKVQGKRQKREEYENKNVEWQEEMLHVTKNY